MILYKRGFSVLAFWLLTVGIAMAQNNKCGSFDGSDNRTSISQNELNEAPYNGIIHMYVRRHLSGTKKSTASFIAKDLIITANHNLMNDLRIKRVTLELHNGSIKLRRRDFKIYHYSGLTHNRSKDIALIKITNPSKWVTEDVTYFTPTIFPEEALATYDLLGFPTDKQDTLVRSSGDLNAIESNVSSIYLIYRNFYTCKGNSGGPLIARREDQYHLLSIHHGKRYISDLGLYLNVGTRISQKVLDWIDSKR